MRRDEEITGGVVCDDGGIYVMFTSTSADEDDRLVASGHVEGASLALHGRVDVADLVSFIPLTNALGQLGQAVALTGEGEVVYFSEDSVRRERIPGAGYAAAGAKKLGRMTTIKQIGDDLIALGYGGQVYIRTSSRDWRYLKGPRGAADGTTKIAYFCLFRLGNDLYFGGTESKRFRETAEMEAASKSGDGRLLGRLIRGAKVPDVIALWKYDGGWNQIGLDYPGAISEMLPYGKSALLFTTKGRIISTEDFQEFEDIFSFEKKASFWDIKLLRPEVVVLFNNALFEWRGELQNFDPPLPPNEDSYINVWGPRASTFAFAPFRIVQLRDEGWTDISYSLR